MNGVASRLMHGSLHPMPSIKRFRLFGTSLDVELRHRQERFESEAMPHSANLLRVARRLTFDPVLAEDLTQEALLRAWRSFEQFQAGTNIRAWLFRILFNVYHTHGRAAAARPVLLPLPSDALVAGPERERTDAEEVMSAFEKLSDEQRAILSLVVIEGFTCRECATILSLPIGTVMSRLSRARQALSALLTPTMAQSPPARPPATIAAAAAAGRARLETTKRLST
jgi:RNA polymerase sigma-70 factor (ECF subfamily)